MDDQEDPRQTAPDPTPGETPTDDTLQQRMETSGLDTAFQATREAFKDLPPVLETATCRDCGKTYDIVWPGTPMPATVAAACPTCGTVNEFHIVTGGPPGWRLGSETDRPGPITPDQAAAPAMFIPQCPICQGMMHTHPDGAGWGWHCPVHGTPEQ